MLLEVFEDRAPPPAAAPAAVQAAAGSAPAGGGEEEEAEAARKLQELDDAAAALQARLAEVRRRAGEDGLSGKALSQRVLCAEVAALTGRSDAELAAMGAKALRKLARQARGAAKRARDAAAGKRSAGAAAAALLDRLFPAAAGGDEAAWAAACAALSEAEREVLRGQGIDLEAYRREVATRGAAAGPAASLGDWLCAGGEGEGEEEGGSAGEVDGPPEGDAEGLEAAAGARAAATLDAAVAAHGGHYLRSCDAAAAGAAGDEQPPWFWEQQQQQEQGAGAPLPAHQQQQPQHAAWQPQEQQEQEQAAWQQQQYWQQLRQQQEQALWQAQAAAQRGAGPLSPLHHEVAALALQATPTPLEVAAVQGAVLAVQEAACSLWPEARTALFGSQVGRSCRAGPAGAKPPDSLQLKLRSGTLGLAYRHPASPCALLTVPPSPPYPSSAQATGLALPGSDLDIVVLGVGPTLANAATGFTPVQVSSARLLGCSWLPGVQLAALGAAGCLPAACALPVPALPTAEVRCPCLPAAACSASSCRSCWRICWTRCCRCAWLHVCVRVCVYVCVCAVLVGEWGEMATGPVVLPSRSPSCMATINSHPPACFT
jgi:hypothetical protein